MPALQVRVSDEEYALWVAAAALQKLSLSEWARRAMARAVQHETVPEREIKEQAPAPDAPVNVLPVKDVPKHIYDAVAAHMLGRDQRAINIAAKRTAQEVRPDETLEQAIARLGWLTSEQVDELAAERAKKEPKSMPRIWPDRT